MIQGLIRLDAQAKARAKAGARAKRGTTARNRADEARAETERLGRIVYFLRSRSPASNATPQDMVLCDALAGKLQAKGQWAGEYYT